MAAGMAPTASTAEISNVHRLFEIPSIEQTIYPGYDACPDGSTFLVNLRIESQNQSPLTIVVNWDSALRQ